MQIIGCVERHINDRQFKFLRSSIKSSYRSATTYKPGFSGKTTKTDIMAERENTDKTTKSHTAKVHNNEEGKQKKEKLDGEQINEYRVLFNIFDKNRDGVIDYEKFKSVIKALNLPYSEEQIKQMMSDADTDNNGVIDFPEFLTVMARKEPEGNEGEAREMAFNSIDTDHDGFISLEELMALMKVLGEDLSEEEVKSMMREADTNGDGKISKEEFMDVVK